MQERRTTLLLRDAPLFDKSIGFGLAGNVNMIPFDSRYYHLPLPVCGWLFGSNMLWLHVHMQSKLQP